MAGKIREHFKKHKKLYTGAAIGAGVGTVVTLVLTRNHTFSAGTINQIMSYKPEASIEVFIEALGDPGNIIQDVATGTVYASQGQAARELGLSASELSKHLNGRNAHVKGHVFTKLGKAPVAA